EPRLVADGPARPHRRGAVRGARHRSAQRHHRRPRPPARGAHPARPHRRHRRVGPAPLDADGPGRPAVAPRLPRVRGRRRGLPKPRPDPQEETL
ncbi:MAG: hypothetical protein AVDCRST_MAG85-1152, partial [uncultured Solirubrobacteraceae bacterium]